jgi:hypothetical protein
VIKLHIVLSKIKLYIYQAELTITNYCVYVYLAFNKRMYHRMSDSFITGGLVHCSLPLCSLTYFTNKRRHSTGQCRRNSLLPQSKFFCYHEGRGTYYFALLACTISEVFSNF